MNLTGMKCVACEGGVPPLTGDALLPYKKALSPTWALSEGEKKLAKEFVFKDFKEAMVFVNKVADIAEAEGHHPDIAISYKRVTLTLWTHAIGGLSENDFIVAAKIDTLIQ